ncbi:MAG: tRNA (adenosine(37)-N6)-threonylcarbamoyltransferase complex transferase subunit TsaD [Burkholderiaceae bacterium]
MLVLGIESSCDETGVAVYCTRRGLLAQALHSQIEMHKEYGGVVPELASRDHIRRLTPLIEQVLDEASYALTDVGAIAYTRGPGLSGALLVGAATAASLAYSLGAYAVPVNHMEGHLLSPLLADPPPDFPFVALLVSGGHTQLLAARGVGRYELLGDTLDDAAGEAFDKSAKLMGLSYPGGPALAAIAGAGTPGVFSLPRPMLRSGDCDFSFSGLKTAVLTQAAKLTLNDANRADLAAEIQEAITEVLVSKALTAMKSSGINRLVVAGGVSANQRLRERFAQARTRQEFEVSFPPISLCSDNGAMIALAGAFRLTGAHSIAAMSALDDDQIRAAVARDNPQIGPDQVPQFDIQPRWPIDSLEPVCGN